MRGGKVVDKVDEAEDKKDENPFIIIFIIDKLDLTRKTTPKNPLLPKKIISIHLKHSLLIKINRLQSILLQHHSQQRRVVIPHLLQELTWNVAKEIKTMNELIESKPEVPVKRDCQSQGEKEVQYHEADCKQVEDVMLLIRDTLVLLKIKLICQLHLGKVVEKFREVGSVYRGCIGFQPSLEVVNNPSD